MPTQQVPYPHPGKRAKSDFKRACPVDATLKGIIIPPLFQLLENSIPVCPVPCRHERLGKQYQMLMAIDLPNRLVIAGDFDIQILDEAEIVARSLLPS